MRLKIEPESDKNTFCIFSKNFMGSFDKRVDAYVAKSAPFAQPILEQLRQLVHKACPKVTETIKWGFPHFEYNGILCSMAAFKKHCSFGFWKGALMTDPHHILEKIGKTSMAFVKKIQAVDDLPPNAIIIQYIKEAMKLNNEVTLDEGKTLSIKSPLKKASSIKVPIYLSTALKKNKKAFETFSSLSPSHKREYIEWISEAKTENTRQKRIQTTMEWLAEGKRRNWKYEK